MDSQDEITALRERVAELEERLQFWKLRYEFLTGYIQDSNRDRLEAL